jgi:hypothetical protein
MHAFGNVVLFISFIVGSQLGVVGVVNGLWRALVFLSDITGVPLPFHLLYPPVEESYILVPNTNERLT